MPHKYHEPRPSQRVWVSKFLVTCHLYPKLLLRFKRDSFLVYIMSPLHLLVTSWITTIISFVLTTPSLGIKYIIIIKLFPHNINTSKHTILSHYLHMHLPRYKMMINESIHQKLYSSLGQDPNHVFLDR
ncbi:D(2) dopamine receptor [Gossypium arboreum]|uniref:D(2) dopamine receptor n=1 Tax=Gossypium arboreum TaxID=29729 RepID=A0A0B0P7Q1_GOSAR|nr:D(2) dopamine receptor [Gossypium arboreum]